MEILHSTDHEIAWIDGLAREDKLEKLVGYKAALRLRHYDYPQMSVNRRRVEAALDKALRGAYARGVR